MLSSNRGHMRFNFLRRRDFITLLGGAVAWPLAVHAQQKPMPVIGFLDRASPDPSGERVRAFRRGLSEAGFVEGRNVAIEYRWADGQNDRLPALTADLVRRQVMVIVATSDSSAVAAKASTATIPIVFIGGGDPVKLGLVASLNRPGGNLTGVTNLNIELGQKRLQLLRELLPKSTIVVVLVNPTNPSAETISNDLQAAARTIGVQSHVLRASTANEIDTVLASLHLLQADALVIGPDAFFMSRSEQLAALTLHHGTPAIFQTRKFAAAGGLMSYGTGQPDLFRQAGLYTGRILKGDKPADLPVEQVTKVELVINMKTAKALGLTFPITLLGRADEVIE
jgi:putative tryptophan/tyrosine transport system substrate-binding protein